MATGPRRRWGGGHAVQAFWRSQNLDAGRIHFARAGKKNGVPARRVASGGAAISTYIITPYNVDILGDLIDDLENNGLYF